MMFFLEEYNVKWDYSYDVNKSIMKLEGIIDSVVKLVFEEVRCKLLYFRYYRKRVKLDWIDFLELKF